MAGDAARVLAGRCDAYGYVSSISVYQWGEHTDESSPVVTGDPDAGVTDYAADKRGAELAVLRHVSHALLVRSGLVLGPHEDVGRLPWWLSRIARGGRVVAPGRPERPLQYVDARDLAAFTLDSLVAGRGGPVDTTSRSGHASTASLLHACVDVTGSDAQLVWVDEATLAAAGAEPWTELPIWVPEVGEGAGFLEGDSARAASWGLHCRGVADTVRDTWDWLVRDGLVEQPPARMPHGLPVATEKVLLRD